MLFGDSESCVVIADGRSGVRLTHLGEANALGFPAKIDVRAGPFCGAIRDGGVNFGSRFVRRLEELYARLRGEAELSGEDGFHLKMVGDGREGIAVSVAAVAGHVPEIRLTFEYAIDQTFLPAILQAIKGEFRSVAEKPASAT